MLEFKRLRHNGYTCGFYKTYKLSNNQTAAIFFLENDLQRGIEYSVVFVIANKKKHIRQWIEGDKDILSNTQTGKCGLEGLMWAKKQLIKFEEFIKYKKDVNVTICIYWTDNRRRNVYKRALDKLGYKICFRHCTKCITKKIS